MREILEIFKEDIKTIISNPVVIIVMIVIICLPSLYALVNISAAWDPYNGTSNMKVAIVDNDAGYTIQGVNYDFGENLSDEIAANNTNFNWQFVDEQTARKGVENGEYFAAFIIPSNFTQTLVSIQTANPQQAQIDYVVNEKLSPVAPKFTNSTANALLSQINLAVYKGKINLITAKLNSTNTNGLITFSKADANDPSIYPVKINKESIYPINSYGSALAPFYMTISLFIGCLIAAAMINPRIKRKNTYHHINVYFGRMGIFIIIAILQALVVTIGVLNLQVQTSSSLLLALTTIYICLCLMIVVYSLTSIFGSLGKLLAVILLVLQIMVTGGTFPIQTMSSTFQNLNPYLPLTYGIDALRQIVAGVYWSTFWYDIMILAIFPVIFLIIALIIKGKLDKTAEWAEMEIEKSGLF